MPDRPAAVDPGEVRGPGAPERPLAFHPLTFLPEGDDVTVGRPDEGEFVVLPADGAALLRRLVDGQTCSQAAQWYQETYGESVDIADFVADLGELGFLRGADEPVAPPPAPVRWSRLGRAVFSPVGAVVYLALIAGWLAAMVRTPALVPSYHHLFFTHYMSVLMVTMYLSQMPLVLLHEAAHALAGRRLGLRSRLSVGRRLYYLVFLTALDGLVGVPRRKRFLPILAGILTDIAVLAGLTLLAAVTRRGDGSFPLVGAFALALAYLTVLRLLWQCWFFLQTDVYYLVVTVLGCVDLQTTAKQLLANRWCALLGRPARFDPEVWHPRDRSVARWYSVLMVAGYAFCLGTLAFGLLPSAVRVFATVLARLSAHGSHSAAGLTDSVLFLLLSVGEVVVAGGLFLRERRSRRAASAAATASSPS
ncbi:hypothetical protein OG500_33020 [Kitasatospora sp. NBC_01250]|uniref:hypothetical protein n=1 Tax=unclassified Kitasatospora TaxID=2633591 RepID=UPI002E0FA8EE|nr:MULTISPECIES: hypothetical protein [unclassified Kitasatospora]WSJ70804.1 hypothetical protein OG294_34545 [Kitasatospora sp. NBC_01302]